MYSPRLYKYWDSYVLYIPYYFSVFSSTILFQGFLSVRRVPEYNCKRWGEVGTSETNGTCSYSYQGQILFELSFLLYIFSINIPSLLLFSFYY